MATASSSAAFTRMFLYVYMLVCYRVLAPLGAKMLGGAQVISQDEQFTRHGARVCMHLLVLVLIQAVLNSTNGAHYAAGAVCGLWGQSRGIPTTFSLIRRQACVVLLEPQHVLIVTAVEARECQRL